MAAYFWRFAELSLERFNVILKDVPMKRILYHIIIRGLELFQILSSTKLC